MRIQHNIAAMNAYRNYTSNTRTVSKNLEKLSSGYRINRAGDDAAGLAISEKMRAQVTSLNTAQKNAKDGISLVQTAEGALTEVHSMLNRMVELADQSANGTYDNEVDRANLQKEVSALKTEINRIADSSNFNGIKLLDGSLSETGSVAVGEGAKAAVVSGAGSLKEVDAESGQYTFQFSDALSDVKADGALKVTVGLSDGTSKDVFVVLKKSALANTLSASIEGALKADEDLSKLFNMTAAGINDSAATATKISFEAKEAGTGALSVSKLTFEEMEPASAEGGWTAGSAGDVLNVGALGTVPATATPITQRAATNAYQQVDFGSLTNDQLNGESVTIGDKTYSFAAADKIYDVKAGTTGVALGNTRNETMKNLAAALKSNGVSSAEVDGNNIKIGNLDDIKVAQNVSIASTSSGVNTAASAAVNGTYKAAITQSGGTANQKLTISYTDQDGKAQNAQVEYTASSTSNAANAEAMAAAINGNDDLKNMFKASVDAANLVITALNDKNGVKITNLASDEAGTVAAGTTTTAYGTGQTVDFDLTKMKSGDKVSVNGKDYQFLKAADVAKADSNATVVLIDEGGNAEESTVKNFQAALKTNGVEAKVKGTGADAQLLIEADTKVESKGGLTLQIGETSESFNQLKVTVDDMHTKALGIADVDISNQKGAQDAVQTIKNAINSVSSTRGTLGATQNRLDHTINNLSVMTENIQDAESNIRDVDVAQEMMAYTKNNILVQSAQAMLAQANQAPQGVLQLLQ